MRIYEKEIHFTNLKFFQMSRSHPGPSLKLEVLESIVFGVSQDSPSANSSTSTSHPSKRALGVAPTQVHHPVQTQFS